MVSSTFILLLRRSSSAFPKALNLPGFRWKIWTEDADAQQAGGIYLFRDHASAAVYVAKHSARLAQFGIRLPSACIFHVNPGLTRMYLGPVADRKIEIR